MVGYWVSTRDISSAHTTKARLEHLGESPTLNISGQSMMYTSISHVCF